MSDVRERYQLIRADIERRVREEPELLRGWEHCVRDLWDEIADLRAKVEDELECRRAEQSNTSVLMEENRTLRTKLEAAEKKLRRWQTDWTNLCAAIVISPTTVNCRHHKQPRIIDIDDVRQRLIGEYYRLQDARAEAFAALDAGGGE